MPTPEEVLEDVFRLRWSESIPESDYAEAIRMMTGFGALIRPPTMVRRRRRAASQEEHEASPKVAPSSKRIGRQALRERLQEGPITIDEATDIAKYSTETTTYAVLKLLGAKRVVHADGIRRWTLRGQDKRSDKKTHGGHGVAPLQIAIQSEVFKAFKSGEPVNLAELRRKLNCSKTPLIAVARKMGAKRIGFGPNARWTIPMPKHVNGSSGPQEATT